MKMIFSPTGKYSTNNLTIGKEYEVERDGGDHSIWFRVISDGGADIYVADCHWKKP